MTTAHELTADQLQAFESFASLSITVRDFLDRLSGLVTAVSLVPGNRELRVGPVPLGVVHLDRTEVRAAAQRYLAGALSREELSNWAGIVLALGVFDLPCSADDDPLLELLHDLAAPLTMDVFDPASLTARLTLLG